MLVLAFRSFQLIGQIGAATETRTKCHRSKEEGEVKPAQWE